MASADEQQMIVLELVKELLRHQMLALQSADELEQVFIGDDVGRGRREFPKQVIDERALQAFALAGQVDHPVGRVRQHLGRPRSVEALQIDRALEQRIEGGGDEQIKVGDRGEPPQGHRRLEVRILDDAAQAHVGFFTPAARREEPADHITNG
jgi:hypothetical protein